MILRIFICLLITSICYKAKSQTLIPYPIDSLYGFSDLDGNVIIKPIFKAVSPFGSFNIIFGSKSSPGRSKTFEEFEYAQVYQKDHWQIINKKGEFLELQQKELFHLASTRIENLIKITLRDQSFYLFDISKNEFHPIGKVKKHKLLSIREFYFVEDSNGMVYQFDLNGEIIQSFKFDPEAQLLPQYQKGYLVKELPNDKWELQIPLDNYKKEIEHKPLYKIFFNPLNEESLEEIERFIVTNKEDKKGLVDKLSGSIVLPPKYSSIRNVGRFILAAYEDENDIYTEVYDYNSLEQIQLIDGKTITEFGEVCLLKTKDKKGLLFDTRNKKKSKKYDQIHVVSKSKESTIWFVILDENKIGIMNDAFKTKFIYSKDSDIKFIDLFNRYSNDLNKENVLISLHHKDGTISIINRNGQKIISRIKGRLKYNKATDEIENTSASLFYDTSGKILNKPKYIKFKKGTYPGEHARRFKYEKYFPKEYSKFICEDIKQADSILTDCLIYDKITHQGYILNLNTGDTLSTFTSDTDPQILHGLNNFKVLNDDNYQLLNKDSKLIKEIENFQRIKPFKDLLICSNSIKNKPQKNIRVATRKEQFLLNKNGELINRDTFSSLKVFGDYILASKYTSNKTLDFSLTCKPGDIDSIWNYSEVFGVLDSLGKVVLDFNYSQADILNSKRSKRDKTGIWLKDYFTENFYLYDNKMQLLIKGPYPQIITFDPDQSIFRYIKDKETIISDLEGNEEFDKRFRIKGSPYNWSCIDANGQTIVSYSVKGETTRELKIIKLSQHRYLIEKSNSFLLIDRFGKILEELPGATKKFRIKEDNGIIKIHFNSNNYLVFFKKNLLPFIEDGIEYLYNFETLLALKN